MSLPTKHLVYKTQAHLAFEPSHTDLIQRPKRIKVEMPFIVESLSRSLSVRLSICPFFYVQSADRNFSCTLMNYGKPTCCDPSTTALENGPDRTTFSTTYHTKLNLEKSLYEQLQV